MRSPLSLPATTLAALLSFNTVAAAASVHLKKGTEATDLGLVLAMSGKLSGVGNGDVLVTMEAEADATVTCTNPAGESQPPGAQPASVQVFGSVLIPDDQTANGVTPWAVVTMPPVTPLPGAPDCPNSLWTEDIVDLAFTAAVLTVEQGGVVVLAVECTIDPPSADGLVPSGDLVCVVLP